MGKDAVSKRQRWFILVTLMSGTFITAMTVTVTATMLPAVMSEYQIPTSTAQWLTSGATLVSGIMIPIAAFLIKRLQSRVYFLGAMAIFCVGAMIGFMAGNFPLLLAGRFVQAMGCGMLMPFSQVVLMTIYPKEQHGSVMGIYALGSTVASVIAPSLAGLIIDFLGWQSIFRALFGAGVLILALGVLFMKNVTETFRQEFPLVSVILSSVGFCGLLIGFGNLSQSVLRMQSGGALCIGVISLGAFVYMQLKSEKPFMDLRIFQIPSFRMSVLMSIVMYLVTMGSGTILPIYGQMLLGNTATTIALVTLPGSILMACVSVLSGKLYDKIGYKILLLCGCGMLLAGSLAGTFFNENTGLLHIGLASCLLSAGAGCLNTPATTLALSGLSGRERVDGSSILNTLRQISSAMAATLAVFVYSAVSAYMDSFAGIKSAYLFYVLISITAFLIAGKMIRNSERDS